MKNEPSIFKKIVIIWQNDLIVQTFKLFIFSFLVWIWLENAYGKLDRIQYNTMDFFLITWNSLNPKTEEYWRTNEMFFSVKIAG